MITTVIASTRMNTPSITTTSPTGEDGNISLSTPLPPPPPSLPPLPSTSTTTHATRPSPPRRSSSLHRNLITRLRPLPFQYVWAVWHSKPITNNTSDARVNDTDSSTSTSPSPIYSLTNLTSNISDIAAFYRVYNNFPWLDVQLKSSVHFFRAGVKPLWEDEQNLDGGCWTLKVRKEVGGDNTRLLRVWEELCLLVCGGELQAELSSEHDHVLGVSYSPRLYWVHISIWTKKGGDQKSVRLLESTVLSRLSTELRPKSSEEYYYRKHSNAVGRRDVVGTVVEVKS